MGATGAGSPTKWAPSSVVRRTEVHTGLVHGATPSSQYWSADMAVNETGSKPEGTGPPAGCEPPIVFSVTAVVGAEVEGAEVVGAEVEEPVFADELVDGTVLVVAMLVDDAAVVDGLVVTGEEVAGELVVEAALLPPPQPAATSPANTNAAGQ